jgi:K+-sensing histidine kinase KdpD
VCQSITDLALQLEAPISVEEFRTLNRCLDDAIASAVTQYGRGNQSLLDAEAARDNERLGFLAHEIRNLDECGGLRDGNVNNLFQPFEQRGADRTGVGLGLAISRWGVEANNGRIYARNLPDHGCIFTIDLPRVALSLSAATVNQGVAQAG